MNKLQKLSLSSIIFLVYSFYYISGYSSKYHNYVIAVLFTTWLVIAFLENKKAFTKAFCSKASMWLFLFLIYYIFTSIIVASFSYVIEYVIVYLFLYGLAIQCKYYLIKGKKSEIKFMIFAIIISFIFFALNAINFYLKTPSAARTLAADYYAYDNIAIGGGYSIAFGSAILSVYLYELVIRKEPAIKKYKFSIIAIIIILEILIFKTESTTTIIANIIGLIAATIMSIYKGKNGIKQTNNKTIKKFLLIIMLIIVSMVIFINIQNIALKVIEITSSKIDNVVYRRFNRIAQKMYYTSTGQSYNNYVDERFNTIQTSWNTFLKYPILGVGYKCGNIFSKLDEYGVGTHSELVDLLAQHGIIGSFFWIMFMITSIKGNTYKTNSKEYIVSLIIMLIFNPFRTFHGFVVILFMIPLIEFLIDYTNKGGEKYGE